MFNHLSFILAYMFHRFMAGPANSAIDQVANATPGGETLTSDEPQPLFRLVPFTQESLDEFVNEAYLTQFPTVTQRIFIGNNDPHDLTTETFTMFPTSSCDDWMD
jgi:hypothetical protein